MEGLEQQAANLAAVQRIEAWLHASLGVRRSVGVETVLSTPKYRKLVEKASNLGFSVRLVYVVLKSAELQMERIRIRVAKGGHDVPEDRSEEHTSELQSLMRISYDVLCLKKKKKTKR